MVIIGLLLIALICLALGLIMQSAVWLVASLIATGGAAYLLYKLRNVIGAPKDARPARPPAVPNDVAKAAVVPGPARTEASAQNVPDDAAELDDDVPAAFETRVDPIAADDVDEVWVIDGRPRYHLGDCAIIKGQDAEPIPYEQATEDGFMPCSLCEPHAVLSRPR
ncbi:MAG: hypothetical protein QOF87_1297 [Pseudonocardiales bacterium]|jgi:hypothetical protein|nr:hypothetical protein [Pseudonocardiales bacterium]MDT4910124.1 hypothetical protein [Pseudonocardiales bacterium]MDT4961650.1 hypothetical protein [Pseudonocardiales bacterium]